MSMFVVSRLGAAMAASLLAVACATAPEPVTVADTAARTPQLSTLNRLIADAGLAETLRSPGPFTVFAPNDEAFKAVPAKTMGELAANKDLLTSVLTFHVLPMKLNVADVKPGNVKTVNGANLPLARAGTFVTAEEAMVTGADRQASNGVVQVVDRVLLPPQKR